MLITPSLQRSNDRDLSMILGLIGGGRSARGELQPGLIEITHFSAEHQYNVVDLRNWRNPNESDYVPDTVSEYGVADTPEQAFEYAKKHLIDAPEDKDHCVFVTHIAKNVSNKGQGGGWRWHKWGEYIGTGKPECEYLDDEPGFDAGVWVFHIYRVLS